MGRPVIYVLAGVNGAGKSSIGGYLLERAGLAWFNPDRFARELIRASGCTQSEANAIAWQEGMRRLDDALQRGHAYAFETTLGGNSVPQRLAAASRSHDVLVWFCGLASPELHIARVKARVDAGGHDIPEAMIHERWTNARSNLIALMPYLAQLRVFDNSAEAGPDGSIPDPAVVLQMDNGKLVWPVEPEDLRNTPDWAKPIVEAAWSS